jgi:hypothetical protein
MKLIIYIILFIILIIYINNQSIEHLTDNTNQKHGYPSCSNFLRSPSASMLEGLGFSTGPSDKQNYSSITDYKNLISPPSISINNAKYPNGTMNNPYTSINQYNANYNPYYKSHLNNSYFDNIAPYNDVNSISYGFNPATTGKHYGLNPTTSSIANGSCGSNWVIKDTGYSDIFNEEDIGGDQINNILNNPKPVVFLDKTMANINSKIPMNNLSGIFNNKLTSIMGPKLPGIGIYQKKYDKLGQSTIINNTNMLQKLSQNSLPILDTNTTNFVYNNQESTLDKNTNKTVSYSDTIIDNNNKYHLLGFAYNHVYNQYYLIYESIIQQHYNNLILKDNMSNMNLQLYNYALVQMENNKEVIKYIFGPRDKINYNDIVYFHQGFIKLGPFIVNNI